MFPNPPTGEEDLQRRSDWLEQKLEQKTKQIEELCRTQMKQLDVELTIAQRNRDTRIQGLQAQHAAAQAGPAQAGGAAKPDSASESSADSDSVSESSAGRGGDAVRSSSPDPDVSWKAQ